MNPIKNLFVYGTLLPGGDSDARRALDTFGARPVSGGYLDGYDLFDAGEYPAAVPALPEGGSGTASVRGTLYALPTAPEAVTGLLGALDYYEECDPDSTDPADSLFRRERLPVRADGGGEPVFAWVYVYNNSTAGFRRVPGGNHTEYRA